MKLYLNKMISMKNRAFLLNTFQRLLKTISSKNNNTSIHTDQNVTIANNTSVCAYMKNRNPRNLERLRIARKPTGFHLDKPDKLFWHKLVLERKGRHIIAKICHHNSHIVIQASTNEQSVNKHLYRANDTNAYINLARVLANRCLECGINCMFNGIKMDSSKKTIFIEHFKKEGICLQEPLQYKPLTPWSLKEDEKTWRIHV